MQAQNTVRLYKGNRLDSVIERDPDEIVGEFLRAVEGGKLPTPGGGLEYAYRLWLASPDGLNCTWDEADWIPLRLPLMRRLNEDPTLHERLLAWVWGEDET